jgi:hypothetical protein
METLVVGSKVKNYIKEKGLHSSSDMLEELNKKVMVILDAGAERTKGNKRSTVKGNDL